MDHHVSTRSTPSQETTHKTNRSASTSTHLRTKRGLVAGIFIIAVLLVGIVVTQGQLDTVAGQAGATEKDIEALRKMAENNRKLTLAIGGELQEQIIENRIFDYSRQVTIVARNSLRKMTEIVESIISQQTDQATRRDQAGIMKRLINNSKKPIDANQYQMLQWQHNTKKQQ